MPSRSVPRGGLLSFVTALLVAPPTGCCTDDDIPKHFCEKGEPTSAGCCQSVRDATPDVRVLARYQKEATAIAVDDAHVYFSRWGAPDGGAIDMQVARVPVRGGEVQLVGHTTDQADVLALNGSMVFAGCRDGMLLRFPKEGGPAVVLDDPRKRTGDGVHRVRAIAIDGGDIVWGEDENILRASQSGGGVTVVATREAAVTAIAVHPSGLYWLEGWASSKLYKLPGGSARPELLQQHGGPFVIADRDLYWASDAIIRSDPAGQDRSWFASIREPVNRIALAGNALVWAETHGVYWAVPGSGSSSLLLGADNRKSDQEAFRDMAVHDGTVYFISSDRHVSSVRLP